MCSTFLQCLAARQPTDTISNTTDPPAGSVVLCPRGFAGTPWRIASLRFGPTADAVPPLTLPRVARIRQGVPCLRRRQRRGAAWRAFPGVVCGPAGVSGALFRLGGRCPVPFCGLASVAGCAFACWRALFQIVLGFTPSRSAWEAGQSQNEAKSRRFGIYPLWKALQGTSIPKRFGTTALQ